MKRMHLHMAVTDLAQSIEFYNTLFDSQPSTTKEDYAKWELEDPAVNFAISTRSQTSGIDHIGIQTESAEELEALRARMASAELSMVSQEGTTCCYAESNKHWVQDPAGIAWETFHTLAEAPTFNLDSEAAEGESACCAPNPKALPKSLQFLSPVSKKPESNEGCC